MSFPSYSCIDIFNPFYFVLEKATYNCPWLKTGRGKLETY